MAEPNRSFESQMMPHLDAAYNLARHLLRNEQDAEDVVHDAYLRALRFFDSFRGDSPRAWLLAIVRHTAFSRRRRDRVLDLTTEFNETAHSDVERITTGEHRIAQHDAAVTLHAALDQLAPKFREVLVLRELEELSYADIARIVRAPTGTVMSRLSRARTQLAQLLNSSGASPDV